MNIQYKHSYKTDGSAAMQRAITRLGEELDKRRGSYQTHESFVALPSDPSIRAEVEEIAQKYNTNTLKYVVVIGIGGSNLGTEAVYRAVFGEGRDFPEQYPRLITLDTTDTERIPLLVDRILLDVKSEDELVILIISKSGGTTETLVNASYLLQRCRERFKHIDSRVIALSDVGTALAALAERQHWGFLPIPNKIGGRFSVFSAVGLLPLRLLGVDIDMLLKGARDEAMQEVKLRKNNSALRTAEQVFAAMHHDVRIWNLFYFASQLESLGKWSRQLIAESLGKEIDKQGRVVHSGITPMVSIGSTDLHSMAQLYFGGPRDKYTTIVTFNPHSHIHSISAHDELLQLIGYKKKESFAFSRATTAILHGVFGAYDKHRLPYNHIQLNEAKEYDVGTYIIWLEICVYLLAEALSVNAFDQPNVEDYKTGTRAMLL